MRIAPYLSCASGVRNVLTTKDIQFGRRVKRAAAHGLCWLLLAGVALIPKQVLAQGFGQIDQVAVGSTPSGMAVNPARNEIYVANIGDSTLSIINGATDAVTTVPVGGRPYQVGVNPNTGRIYVTNSNDGTVTVIDAATLSTTTVQVGILPDGIAVNPVTNKIYVLNICGHDPSCLTRGTVSVIDGATNGVLSVINVDYNSAFSYPSSSIAVNSETNKVYVLNRCANAQDCRNGTVTVIDGATNSSTSVAVGYNIGSIRPRSLAINATTNKIYVVNYCGSDPFCGRNGTVTVINGADNYTSSVNVGRLPVVLAVNPVTNLIYVPDSENDMTIINGATNGTSTITINTPKDVAVDEVTNKIYGTGVTTTGEAFVTMVDGATTAKTRITIGGSAVALAINRLTNRIYISSGGSPGIVHVVGGGFYNALQFVSVPPCRLVDTRQTHDPIPGNTSRSFTLPQLGGCGLPPNVAAYSLNVTVVPSGHLGYLTIWPTGEDQPLVSTLNSPDGRVKANAAIVPAGYQGAVSVFVTNSTHVILDIDGYFTTPSQETYEFHSVTPCRVLDTRAPNGHLGGPYLRARVERDFPVQESSCIPQGVSITAYSMNFTAVPHPSGHPLAYLTVWPQGLPQPVVSTLNNPTGTVVANAAIVPAGVGGGIATFAYDDTDLIADVDGYFAPAGQGGLSFYPGAPCRVYDSRSNHGQPFRGTRTVDVVHSQCGPPSDASAYVFNATVVPSGHMPFLTLWPDGEEQPVVSTLNAYDAFVTSNMAIVPTDNGSIDAYADGLTQLILDVSGYFAP
jgi:YVTN family beta-propeller protein